MTRSLWCSVPMAAALATVSCGTPPPARPAPAPPPALAAELRARVTILAHDSLRGREVGSPGARAAASYLAAEASRLGLLPAGDAGSFYHRVPLLRRSTTTRWELSRGGIPLALAADDIVPMFGAPGLPVSTRASGEGGLVYGGFLQDAAFPPARELRPEDLAGTVLMVRATAPGTDPATTPTRPVLASAFRAGSPVAAILFVAEGDTREAFRYARDLARKGEIVGPASRATANVPRAFLVSPSAAERIVGSALTPREPRAGLGTFRYTVRESVTSVEAFNVVAVLPGSDSLRQRQYVALGAHYDHLGVESPAAGDSILNGADDNASGSAALLGIAERFAGLAPALRPARSLLFVWHTAEELGLRGSDAWMARPTVPRDSVVAQLNLDMVARNARDSLFVVGSRRGSGELAASVAEANRRQPRPFVLDWSLDSLEHPAGLSCRSDHVNYARYGIPVAFFTGGPHAEYHKPSDEAARLDYGKLAAVTRLVGDVAAAIGSKPAPARLQQTAAPLCR